MVEGRRCLRSADVMELLVPATRCKTLGDRAFPVAAIFVPGTLYHRLLDWRHHFVRFADALKLNCSVIHTLRNTSILTSLYFVSLYLCIYVLFIVLFVKCPSNSFAIMQLYNLNI